VPCKRELVGVPVIDTSNISCGVSVGLISTNRLLSVPVIITGVMSCGSGWVVKVDIWVLNVSSVVLIAQWFVVLMVEGGGWGVSWVQIRVRVVGNICVDGLMAVDMYVVVKNAYVLGSVEGVPGYVDSVGLKYVWADSTVLSDEVQGVINASTVSQCVDIVRAKFAVGGNGACNIVDQVSLMKLVILVVVDGVVHAKVLVDPNLGVSSWGKTDHLVVDRSGNYQRVHIIEAFKGVVHDDVWFVSVEPADVVEGEWDSFGNDVGAVLRATESEASFLDLGSKDLNPVGCRFSFMVDFDLFCNFSFWFNVEMILVTLSSGLSMPDGFMEISLFDLIPVFVVVVQFVGFAVLSSHWFVD
jgi:hypothetical protein